MNSDRTPPFKGGDTTLYRIARDVGFNSRVEPFWLTYLHMRKRMGFWERWREKRRLARLIEKVNRQLRVWNVSPGGWDGREGECVCNLRVAKLGLITELKTYLRVLLDDEAVQSWPHVMSVRDRATLLLPCDFPRPMALESASGLPSLVASSVRVQRELAEINERLRLEESFAIRKMVDFMDATDKDIAAYEARFGTADGFWAKFAYILLKKLCDTSVQRGLPVLIA